MVKHSLESEADRRALYEEAKAALKLVAGKGLVKAEDDQRLWRVYHTVTNAEPKYQRCSTCTSKRVKGVKNWVAIFEAQEDEAKALKEVALEVKEKTPPPANVATTAEGKIVLEETAEGVGMKPAEEAKLQEEATPGEEPAKDQEPAAQNPPAEETKPGTEAEAAPANEGGGDLQSPETLGELAFHQGEKKNPYQGEERKGWAKGWANAERLTFEEGEAAHKAQGEAAVCPYETPAVAAVWKKGFEAAKKAATTTATTEKPAAQPQKEAKPKKEAKPEKK